MMALGRNHMSPSLVLNWMKSLMVGLLSAARFAIRFLTALVWAGGSSGRGLWGDCRHHAVDGSVTAPLAAPVAAPTRALRTVVTACAIAAPAFLVTVCLRARVFVLVTCVPRVGPLGVDLLGSPPRTPRARRRLLCEGFFRLEQMARALGVLPREPADLAFCSAS